MVYNWVQYLASKFNNRDRRAILSKMAASRKVQVISTKYFMCINWKYYVIYLQNIKFVQLILWPGGACTDDTYTIKPESGSHIRIHSMNHDYTGSFWQCQMSQKVM